MNKREREKEEIRFLTNLKICTLQCLYSVLFATLFRHSFTYKLVLLLVEMSFKLTASQQHDQQRYLSSPSVGLSAIQKKSKPFLMYDQLLETRGYKLMGTIGFGSYAKVK